VVGEEVGEGEAELVAACRVEDVEASSAFRAQVAEEEVVVAGDGRHKREVGAAARGREATDDETG
jgi:hypothetical protein